MRQPNEITHNGKTLAEWLEINKTEGADLSRADLSGANLSGADLSRADLSYADLSRADLSYADLSGADLRRADLRRADLSGANLSHSNLSGANLSGCKNLINPIQWMADNFQHDDLGWIVYKGIGNTSFNAPDTWNIEAGSFIEEVVNANRTDECGCGVNFATQEWIKKNYKQSTIWKCRIRWMDACAIVVPYNTDGKARCERLELIAEASDENMAMRNLRMFARR